MTTPSPLPLRAAVVGATGYSGQELIRLLARHPHVTVTGAFGSGTTDAPRRIAALARIYDGDVVPYSDEAVAGCADVAFIGLPEAASATVAPALLGRGVQVIDLSGAFRLKDPALRARFYPATPDPLPDGTVYSLPEFDAADVPGARLVSCPGCYPTAAMLSLLPLARAGLLQGEAIVDAKSGISGAGKGASERTHFSENHGSVAAYGLVRPSAHPRDGTGARTAGDLHAAPGAAGPRDSRDHLCAAQAGRRRPRTSARRTRAAYAGAFFVRLTGDRAARDQARRAHQLLRHRLEGGRADGPADRRGRARQPAQGRGWPGHAAVQPARAASPRQEGLL